MKTFKFKATIEFEYRMQDEQYHEFAEVAYERRTDIITQIKAGAQDYIERLPEHIQFDTTDGALESVTNITCGRPRAVVPEYQR